MYGKHHSEESRQKMSLTRQQKPRNKGKGYTWNKARKKFICYISDKSRHQKMIGCVDTEEEAICIVAKAREELLQQKCI